MSTELRNPILYHMTLGACFLYMTSVFCRMRNLNLFPLLRLWPAASSVGAGWATGFLAFPHSFPTSFQVGLRKPTPTVSHQNHNQFRSCDPQANKLPVCSIELCCLFLFVCLCHVPVSCRKPPRARAIFISYHLYLPYPR
jgi:hypothetical protein